MKKLLINIAVLIMGVQAANAGEIDTVNAKRLTVFGEYLYWYASEQTDAVWANDIGFPATNHVTYSTPNLQFNWSSGFRGGMSYAFPDFWDVTLVWTHLPTNKSVNYSAAPFHIMT
ncbi:MAG: Lpg1974 family pore-forming outer membrane protein [Gammaproteobacteria bacterium]